MLIAGLASLGYSLRYLSSKVGHDMQMPLIGSFWLPAYGLALLLMRNVVLVRLLVGFVVVVVVVDHGSGGEEERWS